MREAYTPPPNLFRSRAAYRGFLSKNWVPTSFIQRIVGFLSGLVMILGTSVIVLSTVKFRSELRDDLHSEVAAFILSLLVTFVVLCVAVVAMNLGIRLVRGSFRRSQPTLN